MDAQKFYTHRTMIVWLNVLLLTGAFITNGFLPIPMFAVRLTILAITIILILNQPHIISRIAANRLLLLLLLYPLLSALWSPYPILTIRRVVALTAVTLLGIYTAETYPIKQQTRLYLSVMIFILIASIGFVFVLPEYAIMTGTHLGRWNGILSHKNVLARLATVVFVCLLYLRSDRLTYSLWQRTLLIALSLLILYFSESASAWIIILIFTLAYPFLAIFNERSLLFGVLFPLYVILAVSLLTISLLYYESIFALLGRDPTITGRVDLWTNSMVLIYENLWFGQGYSAAFLPNAPIYDRIAWALAANAHNGWLDIGLELGLIGIILYTLSLLQNLIKGLYLARTTGEIFPMIFIVLFISLSITETSSYILRDMLWVIYVSITLYLTPMPSPQQFDNTPSTQPI